MLLLFSSHHSFAHLFREHVCVRMLVRFAEALSKHNYYRWTTKQAVSVFSSCKMYTNIWILYIVGMDGWMEVGLVCFYKSILCVCFACTCSFFLVNITVRLQSMHCIYSICNHWMCPIQKNPLQITEKSMEKMGKNMRHDKIHCTSIILFYIYKKQHFLTTPLMLVLLLLLMNNRKHTSNEKREREMK